MTIRAGTNGNIREAGGASLGRAAVRDLSDPADIIELEVPLLVEGSITHWKRRRRRSDAGRHWIVNVKVLSAALFSLTNNSSTTMLAEDKIHPVQIVLECIIAKEVLAHMGSLGMAINHNCTRTLTCHIHGHNLGPLTVKVDLKADGVAMLVVFLTSLIDTLLSSTLAQELSLGVVMEENVNIAFDLLCC
jgi:hypothetical protein